MGTAPNSRLYNDNSRKRTNFPVQLDEVMSSEGRSIPTEEMCARIGQGVLVTTKIRLSVSSIAAMAEPPQSGVANFLQAVLGSSGWIVWIRVR